MAIELATAYVQLQASARGIGQSISAELGAPLAAAGVAGGKQLDDGVKKGLNAKAAGAAAGKALAVGIGAGIAGGVALFKIGETFDAAFDTIRVGTGATGEALEGLKEDFAEVFKNVPADAQTVGTAIADLNTRLGLTGEPLQDLSEQFINLSRITETDLAGNINTLTRVFGDWGIAADELPGTLDQVFRASQASGIGLEQLSASVVQFGAPLRNLGFGFEESLALLSQFDKAGVNTSTVFAGLKAGVGKLAKAGEDVPATFRRVLDEIQALGPGTEATAAAIELFGQRAGPDLADAIAGGKFEIDALLGAITDGSDTINQAAADTASFGEKWQILVNRVLTALQPAATVVFEAVGEAVEALTPAIESAAQSFAGLVGFFQRNQGLAKGLAIGIGALVAALTGLFVFAKVAAIFAAVGAAITKVVAVLKVFKAGLIAVKVALLANPIGLIIAGIVLLGVALFAAYKRFEGFRNVVDTVGRFIRDTFLKALDGLRNWWETNGPKIIAAAKTAFEGIKTAAEFVGRVLGEVFRILPGVIDTLVIKPFQDLATVVGGVFSFVGDVISFWWNNIAQPVFAAAAAFFNGVLLPILRVLGAVFGLVFRVAGAAIAAVWGGVIQPIFEAIGSVIRTVLLPVFRFLGAVVGAVFGFIADVVSAWWRNVVQPVLSAVIKFITETLVPKFQQFAAVAEKVFDNFEGIVAAAWAKVRPIFDAIRNGIGAVASFIGDRIDDIKRFFGGLGSAISSAVSGLASIIESPFKAAFNAIARLWNNTVGSLSFTVPDWVPGIGGRGFSFPKLPTFHTGGIVPGVKGSEQMILALAGERVLSPAETRSYETGTMAPSEVWNVTYQGVEREPSPEDLLRVRDSDRFRRGLLVAS